MLHATINPGTSTAEAAADFFEMFAIGAIPDLLAWTNGQIIFKVEKNSSIALLHLLFIAFQPWAILLLSSILRIWCSRGWARRFNWWMG